MTLLNLDQLFEIAMAAPALDLVEDELRQSTHENEANALHKLQEDSGVQIDRIMTGSDGSEPAPGPETARLNKSFEPVTIERVNTLQQARDKISDSELKASIATLIEDLGIEDTNPDATPVVDPENTPPAI